VDLFDLIVSAVAVLVAVSTVVRSTHVRTIVGAIFRKPKAPSIVLTLGDTTISLDNPSPEEVDRLVQDFITASQADNGNPPAEEPPATLPPEQPEADR
jgi:hypothetical protein